MKKFLLFLILSFGTITTFVIAQNPQPVVDKPVYFDVSPPLTEITPTTTPPEFGRENNEEAENREYPFWEPMGPDPVWQKDHGTNELTDAIIGNFAGINCPSGLSPSDDNGDIGPNHYIQTVNSQFQIFNRNGSSAYGPVNINTLFSTLPGGTCNSGDPIVLYDQVANRWLISQFSVCTATYYMHIAVSTSADPLGTYYRWAYSWGTALPDYPKFGVWRDSYLLGLNNGAAGVMDIVAFDRAQMIAGNASPQVVKFDNPWRPASGLHCVQPLDNDGTFAAAGSPGLFITINDNAWGYTDQLWIYTLTVNWASPGSATFTRINTLNTAAFDSNFGGSWLNIPQPGTTQKLELLSQVLMYRAQYRNFGTYQTIVCCHDVDVNGADHAGIRWYELRNTGSGWSIYQQGTYAPDTHERWMGSIAMNGSGEIALGYSVSSSTVFPSIRCTGRKATDPLGTMTFAEQTIWNGTESQTGAERWGDYSSMSVDPNDDKTFWYTTQYAGGSAWNWHTRIAFFNFDLYCAATSTTCDEYISRVQLGTIDNSSGCNNYRDYTNLSTNIPLNAIQTLTVTNGNLNYPTDQCGVWIDWNKDNDFADANEIITVSGTPGIGPYTALIDPPASATTGAVRLRIRITYTGAVDPCGTAQYGEVEDYTINLTPNTTINTWLGVTSTDWNTGSNWSLGIVPSSTLDVQIQAGTPFSPVIASGVSANCASLYMNSGSTLTQNSTSYFYCYGTFDAGFGTFTMNGTTSYLYLRGSSNSYWYDDYQDDTYSTVVVWKDNLAATVNMQSNMNCNRIMEVFTGTLSLSNTTLTCSSALSPAFAVKNNAAVILDNSLDVINCSGTVQFYDGSQATLTNGTIRCAQDFIVNANTSYNIAFTGGTLIMNGSSTQYINDLDGGNLDLYNLTIAKTGGVCYLQSANLDVNGSVLISGGALSCTNAPSPSVAYNINVAGNWTNNIGAGGFIESTGRVIFDAMAISPVLLRRNLSISLN